jgi:hypothetical protein
MSKRTAEIAGVDVTVTDKQDPATQPKIARQESHAATLPLLHDQLTDALVRMHENIDEANEHTCAAFGAESDAESDDDDEESEDGAESDDADSEDIQSDLDLTTLLDASSNKLKYMDKITKIRKICRDLADNDKRTPLLSELKAPSEEHVKKHERWCLWRNTYSDYRWMIAKDARCALEIITKVLALLE